MSMPYLSYEDPNIPQSLWVIFLEYPSLAFVWESPRSPFPPPIRSRTHNRRDVLNSQSPEWKVVEVGVINSEKVSDPDCFQVSLESGMLYLCVSSNLCPGAKFQISSRRKSTTSLWD